MDFVQVIFREHKEPPVVGRRVALFYGDGCLAKAQYFVEKLKDWSTGSSWRQESPISVPVEDGDHATWMWMERGVDSGYLVSWGRNPYIYEGDAVDEVYKTGE